MALGNYFAEKNTNKYNSPEFRLENINHEIEFAQKDYDALEKELKDKDPKKLEEVKAANTLKIENLKSEKTTLEAAIKDPSKSQDLWKTQLTEQITNLEQQLKDETQPERYKAQFQSQLKQLKYLQANNIKPMTDSDFNAYNYIKIVITVLGSFLLGLGIALFMSDIVSGECTPATLKFLLIQPVSRAKVLLSKFIAICITTVSMIISIELIAFLVVGLVKGFGNSNYPMAFGTKFEYDMSKVQDGVHPLIEVANSTTIISLSQFTFRALLLQALFIVSCCAFVFMISSLVKSSMISMAISTSVLIAANIFNLAIAAFRKVSYFLFTSFRIIQQHL